MVDQDAEDYRPRRAADGKPSGPASTPRTGGSARSSREADDATTLLPRTASGSRLSGPHVDDFDDRPAPGQRLRLALLVAAVAAVVVVGLAIGYAVINGTERPGVLPSTGGSAGASGSAGQSTTPSADALLDDGLMLSGRDALLVDPERAWKVSRTQRGSSDDAQAACLGGDPVEGQPTPQQVVIRLLTANGKNPPGILHRADAYASPEEAAQAYAVAAKTLGGCTMPGAYVAQGKLLGGIGDQAVGVVLKVTDGSAATFRSVAMSRTGRVLNVIDVAQPAEQVGYGGVTRALAAATARQCSLAGGKCNGDVNAQDGPPPIGGDEPGFLATADLPPAGKDLTPWVGSPTKAPDDSLQTSGCETTNWATVAARSRLSRVYLQQDGKTNFGLDEVVITAAGEKQARDLVKQVKSDLDSCKKRKLTAAVSDVEELNGRGAQGVEISGWTATVTQEATRGKATYRVGISSAGAKVVFTFMNPQPGLDLTKDEFVHVSRRAAERATQVK